MRESSGKAVASKSRPSSKPTNGRAIAGAIAVAGLATGVTGTGVGVSAPSCLGVASLSRSSGRTSTLGVTGVRDDDCASPVDGIHATSTAFPFLRLIGRTVADGAGSSTRGVVRGGVTTPYATLVAAARKRATSTPHCSSTRCAAKRLLLTNASKTWIAVATIGAPPGATATRRRASSRAAANASPSGSATDSSDARTAESRRASSSFRAMSNSRPGPASEQTAARRCTEDGRSLRSRASKRARLRSTMISGSPRGTADSDSDSSATRSPRRSLILRECSHDRRPWANCRATRSPEEPVAPPQRWTTRHGPPNDQLVTTQSMRFARIHP